MDAQNAVEPASSKPTASPKRPGSDSDQPRPSATAKPTSNAKPEPSLRDRRSSTTASHHNNDDDAAAEGNSDAETIVLPGKDGHSPSKVRKIIKREDRSDGEDPPSLSRGRKQDSNGKQDRDGDKGDRRERKDKSVSVADNRQPDRAPSLGAKKKKLVEKPKAKDGSSGLSSAPASPPQRRRRASNAHSKSDSETAQVESPRTSSKEKPKSTDKLVPHKRKAPRLDSDDEGENRKARRPRYSGSGLDASRKPHPPPAKQHSDTHSSTRTRSISPQPRPHRRTFSSQLPGQYNGLSHKKKRVPAPLQTDYQSDESSASGSPHPRSSKLRSLTTPATTESTVSPAKLAPHKKHLDAHGQTFLARACAKGEYETAKQRLQERPEDINVADYAGNTPLQISALNGFDDIVKLLVDAGCNLECVNNDKDTPLLDAVENGHLEVVKILLTAGVNPRKANAYGQEPIDRVTDDLDHAEEIKRALQDAKQKMGERRRTSEDHHLDHTDARSSHGPESPRRSPGAAGSIHAASGRRAGTVRSNKTSNHLLYMPMDDKTLRAAAARGDEETVIRILQVRDKFDDPESMVAAARGGHDIVMQLLLALGKANPDPAPIANSDYSTPMLAAIGQENIKVVRLLLDQADFDPLRRYKGEAYHELARRRRGPNWIEEEQMLKDAYDKKSHRDGSKTKSPNRREHDRESRRSRAEPKDEASRSHKRKASSPTRDPKEKRRSNSVTTHPDDQTSPKRGPGRPKKEDRIPTIAISDREASPIVKPTAKAKRVEPDLAAASSEGETVKPRRKLVSGRELKGEREKIHRRASMTSNASSLKEPSSPREESEKPQKTENIHVKSEDQDVDMPDAAQPVPRSETEARLQKAKEAEEKKADERRKKKQADAEADARAQAHSQALEDKKREEERKRKEEEEKEKESERIRLEEETKRRLEAEAEARRREEEREKKRQEEEERKRKEEEDRKQRELEERQKREEEERRRLEEENKRKEEEEREQKRKEEEERRQREEEERRKEEEEKKREEEERLRKEQLEREAAEESRRKREEEERKERERALREEMERRKAAKEAERAARDAEQRRIRLEQERIRLAKLPPVLRWLDGSVNPKTPEVAEKFRIIQGVRYDCIRPEATGTAEGREQWLLNTQAALLLGEKDLDLSRYTAWERIPTSYAAKRIIWRLESDRFALTLPNLYELGKQIPDYYGDVEPERMSYRVTEGLRADAWKKFVQMDTFFVKASDFMYIVPTIPHLRSLRLTMEYRELPEDESLLNKWTPLQKWKNDPDANRNYGFAPGNKHFINGELISEDRPGLGAVSTTPFPEKRVPRRGLVAVFPDDPAYSTLCKEQGLEHLLGEASSPLLPNGMRSSPAAPSVNGGLGISNGQIHGNQPISPSSESGAAQARPLVNGVNGVVNGSAD
ncbi:hypothetical protein B0H67DRAFT_602009 [Lasiosphaeris hirsuta]|uniref:Protein HOS4 n=1 Tax=Lasiosphaeris hirsuta TaxID=260670 RepID=A0AA40DPV3_9PEZI|nr:hypothetical protein B0H67DRAFT_602009 [Lasiosphaeris hirsuta]